MTGILELFTHHHRRQFAAEVKVIEQDQKSRQQGVPWSVALLGLIPLAVGMNINFVTMFTELNPHIYFGGDNRAFWGPLSWTIIFGLSFATFLEDCFKIIIKTYYFSGFS